MKTKIDRNLQNFLEDFGLSEREILLYLTLLRTGPNTIMNLARETAIKRSTTHNNVEELIKKGLVSQTNYGERRMVIAEDPEKLKFLMEQKKYNIKKLEENLPSVINVINSLVPEARENSKVEVKYYDGEKSVMSIYEEALSSKELRSYVNLAEVFKVLPDNGQLFVDGLKKNPDLHILELFDNSNVSNEIIPKFAQSKRHQYKFTGRALELSALDILIFDNKVATITFEEGIKGFVVYNQNYYNNSVAIFNFIWNSLEAIKA